MNTQPASTINGLILDYGEVLCKAPGPALIGQMASRAGLAPETFLVRYYGERNPYDRGDLTPADYWSRVLSGAAPPDDELLEALRHWDVEIWSDIDRDMTDWLHDLRAAGLKTALLSNMHPDMARYARRSFDWLEHLDCVILSCEVRLIKPDRAIYQRCLEGLGLPPSDVCFIDDRNENVQGAKDAGLTALQFQTVERLRNDLTAIGVPVLPRVNSTGPASSPGER